MRDDEVVVKVWLSRGHPSLVDNVVWIESSDTLLTLTEDGKLLTYKDPLHNSFVIRLLDQHTDDWEVL